MLHDRRQLWCDHLNLAVDDLVLCKQEHAHYVDQSVVPARLLLYEGPISGGIEKHVKQLALREIRPLLNQLLPLERKDADAWVGRRRWRGVGPAARSIHLTAARRLVRDVLPLCLLRVNLPAGEFGGGLVEKVGVIANQQKLKPMREGRKASPRGRSDGGG